MSEEGGCEGVSIAGDDDDKAGFEETGGEEGEGAERERGVDALDNAGVVGRDDGDHGAGGERLGETEEGRTILGLLPERNVCLSLFPKERLNRLSIFGVREKWWPAATRDRR